MDLKDPELKKKFQDWQDYYNEFRPHGSLNGKTPWEKWGGLFMQTPYHDEVEAAFDESKNGFDCKIIRLIYTGKN